MDAAALRSCFPVLQDRAYLNAGTCGPLPATAVQAAAGMTAAAVTDGRAGDYFAGIEDVREPLRAASAALLGAQPRDVALTTCTSEGMVRVLQGIGLRAGDEILTAPDEHPGLLGPLAAARRLLGVRIRTAPLADLPAHIGPDTRLVACSHVSWITGALAPDLSDRPEGVALLLDGAQGAGAVPVDVAALGCDFYAAAGQKWLCGPVGTGMLWIAPDWAERLACPGPTYVNLQTPADGLDAVPADDARRHDASAIAPESWLAARTAHDVLAAAGWDAVHGRAADLADDLARRLTRAGHTVAARDRTTLVSWEHPDPPAARAALAEVGVIVRDLPGTPYLRASVGAWNDEDDLDRLLAGLASRTL